MSATHSAATVAHALAALSIACYEYEQAWTRNDFSAHGLESLKASMSQALRTAKAVGAEADMIQDAIRNAVREVPMPRA